MNVAAVVQALETAARVTPAAVALRGLASDVSYAGLHDAVCNAAEFLGKQGCRALGLAMDNGPQWAAIDLAALKAVVPLVPLPFFFTPAQVGHALRDAGIDCVLTDQPEMLTAMLAGIGVTVDARHEVEVLGCSVAALHLEAVQPVRLPQGTVKVTYTSGTTGAPKGVCLGLDAIDAVTRSLVAATHAGADDRHVSLLPLSTLLENIAGLYVPLLAGASTALLPFAEIGLQGAAGVDLKKMAGALASMSATTTVLTPELLRGLLAVVQAGFPLPAGLRFVAVGGAPVAESLIERARTAGIPVYEGYGLSECASVVALNAPGAERIGSVGKPLPHVALQFAADGEILVGGANLLGYAGAAYETDACWPTGDLGRLDADGYLYITGRKKNMFITSFGRNVAPEWVERELTDEPAIAQAAVFGEARPWNVAVIVCRGNPVEMAPEVGQAIERANRRLPDYAQVRCWISATTPFTPQNGQLTANGRLKRETIQKMYQESIENLYEESEHGVL